MKTKLSYFALHEVLLWIFSAVAVCAAFFIFGGSYLNLAASFVGITSLIFSAKGNPVGQALMIVFSVMYGIISLKFHYYGEMITYLGMTAPMAAFSLVSWIRHPVGNRKAEVKLKPLSVRSVLIMALLTVVTTGAFYYILKYIGNANLVPSTVSVATSFAAAYLTFVRSRFFALAYALNDIVLVVLWTAASVTDISYLTVDICFAVFLLNDFYGFINLTKISKRQGVPNNC